MSHKELPEVPAFALNPVLKRFGVSKRQLSKRTGIPYAMLCRLARARANPTWQTIFRLAAAIGCSVEDFAHRKERPCRGKS